MHNNQQSNNPSEPKSNQAVQVIRILHALVGLGALGVVAWDVLTPPSNPWVFWAFLAIGTVTLLVAFFGNRRTVIDLLVFGGL